VSPSPTFTDRCARFEDAWKSGQEPKIEDYLGDVSEAEIPVLLRELVRLDSFYRRMLRDTADLQDYRKRFPVLNAEQIADSIHAPPPASGGTVYPEATTQGAPLPACPHCHNPLPFAFGAGQEEVICPGCGGSFRVAGYPQASTIAEVHSLGRFQLLERVGQGAFGAVWRARDTQLDRIVALKIPHAGLLASKGALERLEREARAAAQLRHPRIVRLYELITLNGIPVLVSDYIEGVPLPDLLRVRRLTIRESAELVADVAEALDYAHGMGLVHRDIKPGNIMMEQTDCGLRIADRGFQEGNRIASGHEIKRKSTDSEIRNSQSAIGNPPARLKPVLVDFGLALREGAEIVMTVEGQILGTPAYMSPEQAAGRGHAVDRRSDIYGLGVVLYQLLCGELPFRGSKPMLVYQVLHDEPRPPRRLNDRIPKDLETICLKAMAKEPRRRYDSAREMADDLRRFLRGEPVRARPAGRVERLYRWSRRNPLVAGLIAAVAFVLVAGTVTSSYWAIRAQANAKTAREEAYLARRGRYITEIHLAHRAWKDGQIDLVQEKLQAQPEEFRDFEWQYLRRLCRLDLETIQGHSGRISNVTVSPDGRSFATASCDGTAKIWDMATGQVLFTLGRGEASMAGAAFSPDGRMLATSYGGYGKQQPSTTGVIALWDTSTGQELFTLRGHIDRVNSVAFSPDGKKLAAVSGGYSMGGNPLPGELRIWDLATKKELLRVAAHNGPAMAVAFHPDGKRIATAGRDRTAKIWDVETGNKLLVLEGHGDPNVDDVAFSPDGTLVATACWDSMVRLWDTGTGNPLHTFIGHSSWVHGVRFSPDGERLASSSTDRTIRIWDLKKRKWKDTLRGHSDGVTALAFHPDGWRLTSAGASGTVKHWDAHKSLQALTLRCPSHEQALVFMAGGRRLISAGVDHVLRVWDPGTGSLIQTMPGHKGRIDALAVSADRRFLASADSEHIVIVWGAISGNLNLLDSFPGAQSERSSISFNSDPNRPVLAWVTQEGTVKICDLPLKEKPRTPSGPVNVVSGLAFRPGGNQLALVNKDRKIEIWQIDSPRLLHSLEGPQDGDVQNAFSPDGTLLAAAGIDQTIRVWQTRDWKEIHVLRGHTAPVSALAFSPDGSRLASGSLDYTVKLWDLVTGQEILTMDDHEFGVNAVAFSPDGSFLASSAGDFHIKVRDARPPTPELFIEQQALSLLRFLFNKHPSEDDVRAGIRGTAVSELVKQKALKLMESLPRTRPKS
jgi:WD40 repeat protein/serine/threonine protein kinase